MKKLNKFVAILVALAMMMVLGISAAFAEDPPATGDTTEPSTPATPTVPTAAAADAYLTKYLQAGTGVDLPGATFNFTITPADDNPAAVEAITWSFADSTMTKDTNGDYYKATTIADLFTGKTFAKAGVYKFTVDEIDATNYVEATNPNDTLTIDNDTFTLRLYVKNDGTGTSIDKVTVQKGENGDKVDPSETETIADNGQDENGENKGMSFTNIYQKNLVDPDKDDPTTQDTTGVLDVTKVVEGTYADKTFGFPFQLAYVLPDANKGDIYYKVIPAGTTNAAGIEAVKATGSPIEFNLKAGDKLIITQAPQGTKWRTVELLKSVTEAQLQNAAKYTAQVDKYATTDANSNTATSQQVLSAKDAVTYTNSLADTDVTPTGILISNLPYIALALVAIGGLVAYVVVRRRQDNEA